MNRMIVLRENNDEDQIVDARRVIVRLKTDVWLAMNKHVINPNDRNEEMIIPMQSKDRLMRRLFDE